MPAQSKFARLGERQARRACCGVLGVAIISSLLRICTNWPHLREQFMHFGSEREGALATNAANVLATNAANVLAANAALATNAANVLATLAAARSPHSRRCRRFALPPALSWLLVRTTPLSTWPFAV